jgi:hypothetical protein
MANEILQKIGASSALTITLASLADGAGRVSAQVAGTSPVAGKLQVFYKITTGGSAPTAGTSVSFFLVRGDDHETEHRDGGVGATDSAVADAENFKLANAGNLVHAFAVTNATAKAYQGSFIIENQGTDWQIAVINNIGQALSSTAGDHWLRVRGVSDEIQDEV